MVKPKILVHSLARENSSIGLNAAGEQVLREAFDVITLRDVTKDKSLVSQIEGVVTLKAWETDLKEVVASGINVKVVCALGVGTEYLDRAFYKARGIRLANTPDAVTMATADMAFGLLLATARGFRKGISIAREGRFQEHIGQEVHGATLGIVGMGRIGYQVARRAMGFDMKVLYHNRRRRSTEDETHVGAIHCETLHEMLPRSDFVVITCLMTPQTQDLFGDKEFGLMKNSAFLINVARGAIVNTDSLVRALRSDLIGGAGLDVTEPEPLPQQHPLFEMENVLITPHWGYGTEKGVIQRFIDAKDALLAVISKGESPQNEL